MTLLTNNNRVIFDPFCLDRANECLWRGSRVIKLRPKAFAVLNLLIGNCGQLVTKDEILAIVWPNTFVTDAVLKVAIRQLREALDDDPKAPEFIETAHRRGYRFIGQITEPKTVATQNPISVSTESRWLGESQASSPRVVGRENALTQMQSWLGKMLRGERHIAFITGEAGIGKTTLVDTFIQTLSLDRNIWLSRGQCLEQYGTGEGYLPVLEAIGRLCREQPQVVDVLRAHAPMWLLQLPSLVSASERESLNRELSGASRERMLREMGDALEVLTSEQPLVFVLEDLHWSDYSTLDLISYLARQRHPAHLMLIGTYRPVELIVSKHPLKAVKQELLAKQQCEELTVEYLNQKSVAEYLRVRFPNHRFPPELSELIHERTEGNPLFMVNAVDYLVAEGFIAEHEEIWQLAVEIEKVEVGVPDSIRQMIEKHIDNLSYEEQRVLEAASVVGPEFSARSIVYATGDDLAHVEKIGEQLAQQRQFIQDRGIRLLPNGEAVTCYGFIHALYQNVLYERVPQFRRVELHLRTAERGEAVYGEQVKEIAAELAMHFERARSYGRAAKYLQQAADKSIRRFAYREAVALAQHGLKLLERVPDTTERAQQELTLQLTLGVPLIATKGYAVPDVGNVYLRARELCRLLEGTPDISEALWGLWTFYIVKADLNTALDIARELLELSERLPNPAVTMRGHLAMEVTFVYLADFAQALEHFEKALLVYDPARHRDDAFLYSQNAGVAMWCHAAWVLWYLGKPDQALNRLHEGLNMARELSDPHGLAHAYYFAAILHHLRRDEQLAQECADAAIAISNDHGLVMWKSYATITRGWALVEQGQQEEAIRQMRQGLLGLEVLGAEVARPHFLALLAEVLGKANQAEEGLHAVKEALEMAQSNRQLTYLAELHRIKGELLLIKARMRHPQLMADFESPEVTEAELCFNEAVRVAREQKAKAWELRACVSLARIYKNRGQQQEARHFLSQIYDEFTEGFDTLDLREAKELLAELL